ncbi:MAG: hypothetical protein QXQ79_01640 [Candidatus Nanoarchaeia archaeon]
MATLKNYKIFLVLALALIFVIMGLVIMSKTPGNINISKSEVKNKTGCLYWTCPTIPNAKYPRDCIVLLCDKEKRYESCIDLKFNEQTKKYRENLEQYYEESFDRCVGIEVSGELSVIDSRFRIDVDYAAVIT